MNFTTPVVQLPLVVGQQLTFAGDPHPWTVKAVSEHFAAAVRNHFDSLGEVFDRPALYTVLDWRNGIRGTFAPPGRGCGTYTEGGLEFSRMLAEFEAGELEVSRRNNVRIEFGEAPTSAH